MISSDNLLEVATNIGPDGPGYAHLPGIIPEFIIEGVQQELQSVPWHPQFNRFYNARGLEVSQAFDVFAHKLSRGSQEILASLPGLCILGNFVATQLVEPLGQHFPSLHEWKIDECVAQRYPEGAGKLTSHKDLERHPQVIFICTLLGQTVLKITAGEDEPDRITASVGDVEILRAPGLYPSDTDIRQEHSVEPPQQGPRISVTFRANTRPDTPIPGFSYHNWTAA